MSIEKYIPLVKHTNWTTILDIPEADFSLKILPNNIPIDMNNTEITKEATIVYKILIVNVNPSIKARENNSIFCIKIIGIKEIMYPNIYSYDFIGLTPSLISNDDSLSLAIKVEVNKVTKEKLKIIIPGVKYSSL